MHIKGLGLTLVGGRGRPGLFACALAALVSLFAPQASPARARQESMVEMARRSSIIVRGTVVRLGASEEPQLAASAGTLVIKVGRMFAGSEIAGDQAGRRVTVILSRRQNFREGDEVIFFANPRYVGKSLTIASEGEIVAKDPRATADALDRAVSARREAPIQARLALSDLVVRGRVTEVRPLADAEPSTLSQKQRTPPSEHDPEWHAATVRVVKALRGEADAGETVTVIFANSRDIMWFHSPKLRAGDEAVFVTHRPTRGEAQLLRLSGLQNLVERQGVRLVTGPFDVLPAPDEGFVRQLILKEVR